MLGNKAGSPNSHELVISDLPHIDNTLPKRQQASYHSLPSTDQLQWLTVRMPPHIARLSHDACIEAHNIGSRMHVTTAEPAMDQQRTNKITSHGVEARADQTAASEPADDFDPATFARFVARHDSDRVFWSSIQWRRGALPLRPNPSHSQRCLVSQCKGG